MEMGYREPRGSRIGMSARLRENFSLAMTRIPSEEMSCCCPRTGTILQGKDPKRIDQTCPTSTHEFPESSRSGKRRTLDFDAAKSMGSGNAGREVFGTPRGF